MQQLPIVIAGAGIGGLTMALTLQQLGIPCQLLESVQQLQPLGLGINLQPNAIRELYELGLGEDELNNVGIQTREWTLVGLNGNEVYSERRGLDAGYHWPQYSVHRGQLQMLLYDTLLARGGNASVQLGTRVVGYENGDDCVHVMLEHSNGERSVIDAALLIGADGLHSRVRAQMHPDQPPIHWGGTIMWRGCSKARPIRTGASFVGLGTHDHRLVFYPISQPDPVTGLADINWIAEITVEDSDRLTPGDWNQKVDTNKVLAYFDDWDYEWLDVKALLSGSESIYEYPMTDRDPIPTWQDGRAVLMGDAAHVMYPVGSNGASQAIVDARILGACLQQEGVTPNACKRFDERLCQPVSALILRNRGAGPFGLLNILDERCGGLFNHIDDVIPQTEREAFMANYKAAAGFDRESLNQAPPTIDTTTLVTRPAAC